MEQRIYRGEIDPQALADALVLQFNTGNLMAQRVGRGDNVLVQIATRDWDWGGPQSALTLGISRVEGGIRVTMGQQQWLGAVADLAQTGLMALINPLSLITRIDDIARSIAGLTLPQQVWEAVEHYCESAGARLAGALEEETVVCAYCGVGNPIGAAKCSACGAPLAAARPIVCPRCGKRSGPDARFCSHCGTPLRGSGPPSPAPSRPFERGPRPT
ncbi:MAG: zinc ribbon domain-containing protein [Thermoflexia bacterium]|nr:MAG: zinc ribbon domain-containing protein [Thermoflexia bacterium]